MDYSFDHLPVGSEVAEALARGQDPMAIITRCLINVNTTEFIDVTPQVTAMGGHQATSTGCRLALCVGSMPLDGMTIPYNCL